MGFVVWWIGDERRPEFAGCLAALAPFGQTTNLPNLQAALQRVTTSELLPDLLVIGSARPKVSDQAALEGLRSAAPLVRIIAVLGPWCDGEARVGRPLEGCLRIGWRHFPAYLAQELQRVHEARCPLWGLPLTATDADRLLFAEPAADEQTAGDVGSIAVSSASREMAEWLAAVCRRAGRQVQIVAEPSQLAKTSLPAVLLWDIGNHLDASLAPWQAVASALSIVLLADFPRPGDVAQLREAGASSVLAKPVGPDEILWQLSQVPAPATAPGVASLP